MINDPKEIIEDLDLENFNFYHLEESFKRLMSRLNINLPQRLYIPFTFGVVTNYIANKITLNDKNIIIDFDPRHLGLMSPKIQHLMSDIKHPGKDLSSEDIAYSVTMDQNMLNSLLVELSTAK